MGWRAKLQWATNIMILITFCLLVVMYGPLTQNVTLKTTATTELHESGSFEMSEIAINDRFKYYHNFYNNSIQIGVPALIIAAPPKTGTTTFLSAFNLYPDHVAYP